MYETGDKEIRQTVIIVVKKPCRKAEDRFFDLQVLGYLRKGPIAVIMVKEVFSPIIGDIEVGISIAVIVGCHHRFTVGNPIDARMARYVSEGSVAIVAK